jgi:hypothetical protein
MVVDLDRATAFRFGTPFAFLDLLALHAPTGTATEFVRSLTQHDDYETAEMTLSAKSGQYRGRIPAAFIDPRWDLMYFVEVADQTGAGGMDPEKGKGDSQQLPVFPRIRK